MSFKVDLTGKVALIAGIGDDNGYGFAIAKQLAEAGATIIVGTWTPIVKIFKTSLKNGKFDKSLALKNGSKMEFAKIYALDASFDTPEDVPEEIANNKRYQEQTGYTVQEVAQAVEKDFGRIDIVVHAMANAPEVKNPLLKTSRAGYLSAMSASAYSFVSLVQAFSPIMNEHGSFLNLTYLASTQIVPGYGGGMSSAKAALESDTRMLAFEVGRAYKHRINCISAGPFKSRAAKAIGFIEDMINYAEENAPLQKPLEGEEVANAALFLLSPLASAVTGVTLFVDNGMHAMGVALDSAALSKNRHANM